MTDHDQYAAGPARGAEIRQDGDAWTLVLVRELHHSPEKVWAALTEPEHLREWAPYHADGSLGKIGTVNLTTVGTPKPVISESTVKRADAPKVLEFNWGSHDIRCELEPTAGGTRLTVWHTIERPYIAMGAAGWHVSLDVMDRMLSGTPLGRDEAMKTAWATLNKEYAKQFGIESAW